MITAVVTTKNEAPTIADLVNALLQQVDGDVIVVDESDDDDETAIEAFKAGAQVLAGRDGIGPSLMAGWAEAVATGATRVLQIDAGGSHSPWEAHRLLTERADLVIGSRFVPYAEHHGSRSRRAQSLVAAAACRLVTRAPYRDWTSGYRAFSRHALEMLGGGNYTARMHGWQMEVLARGHRAGLSIAEVPITYRASTSSLSRSVACEAVEAWWKGVRT